MLNPLPPSPAHDKKTKRCALNRTKPANTRSPAQRSRWYHPNPIESPSDMKKKATFNL
ncbi:hypothetical protein OIDMADRAFT_19560, partial [Oidiodendron maius Zn]